MTERHEESRALSTSKPPLAALLLIGLSIDIGGGVNKELKVYEGESIEERAMLFCEANSLDLKIADILTTQISKILEAR
jgi:hypothetical protein